MADVDNNLQVVMADGDNNGEVDIEEVIFNPFIGSPPHNLSDPQKKTLMSLMHGLKHEPNSNAAVQQGYSKDDAPKKINSRMLYMVT
jgi:hypothetical protein